MADRYASLKQGLVGCWIPSVSGSGLLLPDLSGRGNNGALTNMDASDWVSGQYGRALDFDGTNDEVIANQSAPVVIAKSCSIAAWVNLPVVTGLVNKTIANFGSNTTGFYSLQFSGSPGRFGFQGWDLTNNAEVTATAFSVVADQWIHVAGVASGGVYKIFINGKQENSQNDPHTVASQTAFRIGNGTGYSAFLSMKCDDVRLYNRGLTEPEIKLLASEPGIGFNRNSSAFATRYAYKPAKPRNYGVTRVKETDYGTLRQGLVGAWCPSLANGGSGNTLPDVSGYNNHGVLTNMGPEDWVSGQYGRALEFDGVDDCVSVSNNPSIRPVDGLTVTFWLYLNNVSGVKYFVDNQSSSPFYGYTVAASNAKLVYNAAYNLNLVDGLSNSNLTANKWTHIAVTYDKQNLAAYFNGVLDRSQVATGAIDYTVSQDLSIAARSGNRFWHSGQLDDIRIYSRALTEPEIRLLASRPGIGLRQESHRNTFYQFPSGSRRKRILTGMP